MEARTVIFFNQKLLILLKLFVLPCCHIFWDWTFRPPWSGEEDTRKLQTLTVSEFWRTTKEEETTLNSPSNLV
jgi:hypothetical protein